MEDKTKIYIDQRRAMTQALEALENSIDLVEEDYANAVNLYGKYQSRLQRLLGMETMRDDHRKAIITLREALANHPPEPPPECQTDAEKTAFAFGWWKALEHVRQQPAQQEPVAWILKCGEQQELWWEKPPFGDAIALHTSPPAQRKPLTNEEISEIAINTPPMVHEFARAIEVAHGIKENT